MSSSKNFVSIVDDDESLCRSMGRLLQAANFLTIVYRSAEDFLTDQHRPDLACVLLDIQLGGMSGIELSEIMMKLQMNIPVIFITAQDEPSIREKALATGCVGYFRKSESGAEIIKAIRKAISESIKNGRPQNDFLG